jgi:hypothetical protein
LLAALVHQTGEATEEEERAFSREQGGAAFMHLDRQLQFEHDRTMEEEEDLLAHYRMDTLRTSLTIAEAELKPFFPILFLQSRPPPTLYYSQQLVENRQQKS